MSIFTYLKKDHRVAQSLMDKIMRLDSDATEERDKLFNQLKKELIIHSKAEEKVFYEPLKKEPATEEEIPHAKEEHAEVEEMLDRLSDKSLNGAAWMQLFKKMADSLQHHIEEEEHEIFTDAKKELTSEEAQQMEIAMQKEKKLVEKKIDISLRDAK
ncbi:Alr3199 protein [Legionella beliardensis]|uniref:Alr3199 protein n=1 Tax=Legionella beliardensis TaxID=91822 RepID=A0A378I4A4_9GAMM|nr:hemerythrin domain-containing protein [Legionella beliardensis]STX29521.1 Alr3199 protein [Legionella beliardensis]